LIIIQSIERKEENLLARGYIIIDEGLNILLLMVLKLVHIARYGLLFCFKIRGKPDRLQRQGVGIRGKQRRRQSK